jgi:hypothetical protein
MKKLSFVHQLPSLVGIRSTFQLSIRRMISMLAPPLFSASSADWKVAAGQLMNKVTFFCAALQWRASLLAADLPASHSDQPRQTSYQGSSISRQVASVPYLSLPALGPVSTLIFTFCAGRNVAH